MSTMLPLKRPRWQKVISDLWENGMRTFLVVASIAVGVFAIGTIITAYYIIAADISVTYSASNPANIEIWTDPFDADFVHSVEKIPGVGEVEGRHNLSLRVSRDAGISWDNLQVIAIEDFEEAAIFKRTPVEGNPFPGRHEIAIEILALRTMNFQVGNDVQVKLPDGTVRTMPVVGFVSDQGVTGGPETEAVAYITMNTLEWLGRPQYFNRLYTTVASNSNDDDHIEAVSELVKDKVEGRNAGIYRTILNKTNEHPMTSTVLAILSVLGAMGGLMLILGSALIANTLNALLNQHLRQIGVMKLIGARSPQILGMYIILIIAFSLIALTISIPLSGLAGWNFAKFMANELKITLQGFRWIPQSIIAQIFIALIIPLIAGFLPVNRGSKTSVENAISDDQGNEGSDNESFFDRMGEQFTFISRPILLSIRNTFRRKGRLTLTLFTLIMAGGIFIAVFNVQASLDGFINSIGNLFLSDVMLDFNRPYRQARIEQAALEIPGVVRSEGWLAGNAEILRLDDSVDEAVTFLAPPADSVLVKPKILEGRWLQAGDVDAFVVSDSIRKTFPDIQIGDTKRIAINGKRARLWTLVGIFSLPSPGNEAPLGYTTYEIMSEELNLPDQATLFRLVTENHEFAYQQEMSQAVDDYMRGLGFKVSGVEAGKTLVSDASEQIGILVSFFLIMSILTALVGSIGLAGTMGMNVLERTREIGVMRAIGAVDLEIIKTVVFEGMFIGVISWLVGVVVSFPISWGLLRLISTALINSPMDLFFSYRGFVLWLVVVLILAVLASVIPARNAARLTIREVLAYE